MARRASASLGTYDLDLECFRPFDTSESAGLLSDFVELYSKRNRGWPWPEDSWGLTPMFGEDGWCPTCGVPQRSQTGSLVLQRSGFKQVDGAWIPNWQFDAICLERALAEAVSAQFKVEMLDVGWRGTPPGEARQIVVPSVGDRWFDPNELAARAIARHGTSGSVCPECGTWKWMGLGVPELPPLRIEPELGYVAVVASPEWFGDGGNAFRQILVLRDLAEMIVAASPRDFGIENVSDGSIAWPAGGPSSKTRYPL